MDHASLHDQIASRAYAIWQERGASHGGDQADWFQAEHELRPDSALASLASKVGAALGTVIAVLSDPVHSLRSHSSNSSD